VTDLPVAALGLDAGGTQTRWALTTVDARLLASGHVAAFSGLQMSDEAGRNAVAQVLADLVRQLGTSAKVQTICAGVTGLGGSLEPAAQALQGLLAGAFDLPQDAVLVRSDMEVAYRDVFAPGEGYLVYAGTGSMAVYIDTQGELHRAGGRGGVLDDGGSGYWIAQQALRLIWRAEDEQPGAWRASPLAQRVFRQLGGSDWPTTRQFVYAGTRGAMGQLALAVAGAAEDDPVALDILQRAGLELARLGMALAKRFGTRPVALAGRAAQLHPVIAQSLRQALPAGLPQKIVNLQAHLAAARMAALHLNRPDSQ
jgi:N-acetylglucosamine kinase-like BadF-type ATPase